VGDDIDCSTTAEKYVEHCSSAPKVGEAVADRAPRSDAPTSTRKLWTNAFAATTGDKTAMQPFAKLL